MQQSGDLKDAYENVLRAAETLSIVLGIISTIWAREHHVLTPELDQLQRGFARGVAWGHWLDVVRSIDRPMARHESALPGMADALKLKKGKTGLEPDLRQLLHERNRWAHGAGPRNNLEASERLGGVAPAFLRAVEAARFMAESPWLLVHDVKLRRREGDFHVQALSAMGDHPDFEHRSFTSPTPLAEDVFYLQSADGALDLTPLVVMRPCPTCHQKEVAYADRLEGKNRVALKTFDRGHVLVDDTLADEVRALVRSEPAPETSEAG
ncbi:hypothetical protein BKA19_2185 [Blastococcus saxobsidens]|uniref:Uncharacterized protein n=1 Tax=Blastococcus saxobsidens TaxID=138336 RepID=A0A4Q7Y6F5_9ACTN|nr:hypothetical protein BKA19_2185 [Blastococcus saxobsidens]